MNDGSDGDNIGRTVSQQLRYFRFLPRECDIRKAFYFKAFSEIGYLSTVRYRVMAKVDVGESVGCRKGQGFPQKLTKAQER